MTLPFVTVTDARTPEEITRDKGRDSMGEAMNHAMLHFEVTGDPKFCIAVHKAALEADPKNPRAHMNLLSVYLTTQNLEEAFWVFSSALEADDIDLQKRLLMELRIARAPGQYAQEHAENIPMPTEWDALIQERDEIIDALTTGAPAPYDASQPLVKTTRDAQL
jgi:hypothetical protein